MRIRSMRIPSLLLMAVLYTESGIGQAQLFKVTDSSGSLVPKEDSSVIAKINVIIDINLLKSQNNNSFLLILPKETITIIKRRQELVDGRFVWHGEIKGDSGSRVLLSSVDNVVIGQIFSIKKRRLFSIEYRGKNIHQVSEIDQLKLKSKEIVKRDFPVVHHGDTSVNNCSDSPFDIKLLVVYTEAAKIAAGGPAAIIADIGLYCDITNASYARSDISQRVRLVHTTQVSFTEIEDGELVLAKLINPTDGEMDDVHTLRNTFEADIVALIVDVNTYNGIAPIMETVSHAFESSAFCVVKRDQARLYFVFPHELGHIMGGQHQCPDPSPILPFNYSHGFIGTGWSTIMAEPLHTAWRFDAWSNPDLMYNSESMGTNSSATDCEADDHKTLNNTAMTVANFRCNTNVADNVWMKDTWEDFGEEPNPSGEAMYKSPYIWVRNSQDIGLLHQFEHQNPIGRVPNWVYIKMHNGSQTLNINGHLELYRASASTSLLWMLDWVLVKDTVLTVNSNSSRIIEILWTPELDAGHYCLLARWVSTDDPMHTPETSIVYHNTRENNNIIWRNMNIINLGGAMEVRAEFRISNNLKNRVSQLEFSDIAEYPKIPFGEAGKIYLELDPILMKAWKKGGYLSQGIKRSSNKVELVSTNALITNLKLQPNKKGKITVIFTKKDHTVRNKYLFQVNQYSFDISKRTKTLIGGIAYDILTYKY
jgi:hypothetical protein